MSNGSYQPPPYDLYDEGNPPPVQGFYQPQPFTPPPVPSYPPPPKGGGNNNNQGQSGNKQNQGGGQPNNGSNQGGGRSPNSPIFQMVFQTYAINSKKAYWMPSTLFVYADGTHVNTSIMPVDMSRVQGYAMRWPDGSSHIIRQEMPAYAGLQEEFDGVSAWVNEAVEALRQQRANKGKPTGKQRVKAAAENVENAVLTYVPAYVKLWLIALTAIVIVLSIKGF